MKEFLHHFFLPRSSNNHKARILHHTSLVYIILILFVFQILLNIGTTNFSSVLGEAVHITTQELVDLTNQKRQAQGIQPLVYNESLSKAALEKAKHMFSQNYWAHTSQDGTTPWVFIKNSGYSYVYAGENLARGFTNSGSVVNAWMESPSHKENVLSGNYKDVGFAVLQGNLLGEETTLVVQMFGSQSGETIAQAPENQEVEVPVANRSQVASAPQEVVPSPVPQTQQSLAFSSIPATSVNASPLINSQLLSKNISFIVLSVFLVVLFLDIIFIERKKIARVFTHNVDHVIFFGMLLVLAIFFGKGMVL